MWRCRACSGAACHIHNACFREERSKVNRKACSKQPTPNGLLAIFYTPAHHNGSRSRHYQHGYFCKSDECPTNHSQLLIEVSSQPCTACHYGIAAGSQCRTAYPQYKQKCQYGHSHVLVCPQREFASSLSLPLPVICSTNL